MSEFRTKFVRENRTVGAQFRVGKNPTIPNDVPRNVGNKKDFWKFLALFDKPGHAIYVASDSTEVKEEAKAKLEHAFLINCDVLFLTISEYGWTAGLMRGHSRDMYCLQKTGLLQYARDTLHGVLPVKLFTGSLEMTNKN